MFVLGRKFFTATNIYTWHIKTSHELFLMMMIISHMFLGSAIYKHCISFILNKK